MLSRSLGTVIGSSLKAKRLEAEMTQQDLAEAMVGRGLPWRRETVAQSEGDSRTVSLAELVALCLIFQCPLDAFLLPESGPGSQAPKQIEISQGLVLTSQQLMRLIRRGGEVPQSSEERQRQRLFTEVNSIQVRLTKLDERLLQLEENRKRLRSDLLDRQRKLMDLGEEVSFDDSEGGKR